MKVTNKLRNKLSSKKFIKERLEKFMAQEKELTSFYQFKCDPFFVGRESAKVNTYKYDKKISRVRAEIKWYYKKLMAIEK